MPPSLVSVNVALPQEAAWAQIGRTAMGKRPVTGPVAVRTLGLEGDQVGNPKHHGGADQAVYAFAREDLDDWAERLGRPVADGQFAENLTTRGIDVNAAEIGERWRVGSALLEVCSVRTPCLNFQRWMGVSGYDNAHWVKRFAADARPGPYLRVLEEGSLQAGDEIRVVHRPATASRCPRCSARSTSTGPSCRGSCSPRRLRRRHGRWRRSTSRGADPPTTV